MQCFTSFVVILKQFEYFIKLWHMLGLFQSISFPNRFHLCILLFSCIKVIESFIPNIHIPFLLVHARYTHIYIYIYIYCFYIQSCVQTISQWRVTILEFLPRNVLINNIPVAHLIIFVTARVLRKSFWWCVIIKDSFLVNCSEALCVMLLVKIRVNISGWSLKTSNK